MTYLTTNDLLRDISDRIVRQRFANSKQTPEVIAMHGLEHAICPTCHNPSIQVVAGVCGACDNPGCDANPAITQAAKDRRRAEHAQQEAERQERERIWKIRERMEGRCEG